MSEAKQRAARIAKDVEAFLASGGGITPLPHNASAFDFQMEIMPSKPNSTRRRYKNAKTSGLFGSTVKCKPPANATITRKPI